jgi:hypothetical protein
MIMALFIGLCGLHIAILIIRLLLGEDLAVTKVPVLG